MTVPPEGPGAPTAGVPGRPPLLAHSIVLRFFLYLFSIELFVAVVPAMDTAGQSGLLVPVTQTFLLYLAVAVVARFGVSRLPPLDRRPLLAVAILSVLVAILGLWAGRGPLGAIGFAPLAGLLSWGGARLTSGRPSRLRFVLRMLFLTALLAALLPCLKPMTLSAPLTGTHPPQGAPSVLLVILDTVRWDALSVYGAPVPTSPHIDRLAAEGTRFDLAYANANWTLPGHATMFTGLMPTVHGAHDENWVLSDRHPNGVRLLQDRGWETLCLTGNPLLSPGTGLVQGFGAVHPSWMTAVFRMAFSLQVGVARAMGAQQDKGAEESARGFSTWLARRKDPQRPFFAAVNFVDAHTPYHQVPAAFRDRFLPQGVDKYRAIQVSLGIIAQELFGAKVRPDPRRDEIALALYHAGVATADDAVGRMVEALRAAGRLDDTLILITSDHGELVGEHGTFGHGFSTFEPVIRIPFIARWPGRIPAGRVLAGPIQQVDLLPTLLDLLGQPQALPPDLPGRSFAGALRGGAEPSPVPVIAEQLVPNMPNAPVVEDHMRGDMPYVLVRRRAVRMGSLKYDVDSRGGETLFDLAQDPGERHNLLPGRTADADPLRRALAERIQARVLLPWDGLPQGGPGSGPRLDPAAMERLKALGYVH